MKRKLISALVMAGVLMGCDPAQVKDDGTGEEMVTGDQTSDSVQLGGLNGGLGPDGQPLGMEQVVSYEKNAIYDANSVLAERVIYFDFDSDQISQDYMDLIAHHGKYLAKNPDMRVRLEGHADERGTREYNIALGNRRAQTVQRLISFQGVSPNQVSVVSYGEEKPVALGHDDEAWRLNRRAELVYETN